MKNVLRTIRLPLCAAVLFFLFGVGTVYQYGMNWDEPAHYLRGQAYLRYFLTGKKNYEDIPKLRIHYLRSTKDDTLPPDIKYPDDSVFRRSVYMYDHEGEKFTFNYYQNELTHPPLNDTLAAFTNYIFYQKLGWIGDIEGYHIFTIFVSSVLVFLVFYWARKEYGTFAGIISGLSLVLFPLFLSESHFNIKDPVESSFYAATLFFFYLGITKNERKWLLWSGVAAGFALGTKLNIVFIVFILVPWLLSYTTYNVKKNIWPFSRQTTVSLISIPFIAVGILIASWPSMWKNPLSGLLQFVGWYKGIGYGTTYQPPEYLTVLGINTYPLQWVLYTTPLVILFFSLVGIVYVVRYGTQEKNKTSLLFLWWFLVPVVRVTLPHTGIYGGGRQIMEYIPAMAILSGIGAQQIALWLSGRILARRIAQPLLMLLFLPLLVKLISIHPNQNVYFNSLIGGLKGAKERNFPSWGTTLGSVYQQGTNWLNANAEQGAKITFIKGYMSNIPEFKLRDDLFLGSSYWSGEEKEGEYLIEVVDYYWEREIPEEKRAYIKTLVPVYEVKVDTVTILAIWKNDKEHTISSSGGSGGGNSNSSSPQ